MVLWKCNVYSFVHRGQPNKQPNRIQINSNNKKQEYDSNNNSNGKQQLHQAKDTATATSSHTQQQQQYHGWTKKLYKTLGLNKQLIRRY